MVDIYDEALKKLRADSRSSNELEREIDIPAETIRDIRARITKSPRMDTMKKIVRFYYPKAMA